MSLKQRIPIVANDRGNVLITALLLVFACSIMGATVIMLSSTDLKISGAQGRDTESLFVAEAGLAETVHRLSLANPTMSGGMNVAIGDTRPFDPDWKVYLQMSGSAPTQSGSTWYVPTLQDLSGDYLEYSQASGTDDVIAVEHKWEDRDGDGTRDPDELVLYDPALVPPENFDQGNPIEIVTVTGRSGDVRRVLQAEVTRQKLMMKSMGALYVDKALTISGNSAFCGWNHPMNLPVGTRPNVCFADHLSEDNLGGITTTGDQVVRKGKANDVEGNPPINDDPSNPWYTLAEMLGITEGALNELLANPDNTATAALMDGVTYIDGNATLNAGMVGHGLMYITGDCAINGGFIYYGIVYVKGDMKITGTPWILGSVNVEGTADFNFGAGNCGILYSLESIETYVGMIMPMQVLAWRDM